LNGNGPCRPRSHRNPRRAVKIDSGKGTALVGQAAKPDLVKPGFTERKKLATHYAMSQLYLLPMVLIVSSIALYHIIQKLTPATAHPLAALTISFAIAALSCFILVFSFTPPKQRWLPFHTLNWTSVALAFAIIGTDIGFLLAYRAGWKLNVTPIISNLLVALILIPIGAVFFRERLTSTNLIGVAVCVVGLVMINLK
jgi:drug/metabolite transporter (DMT)-like permease